MLWTRATHPTHANLVIVVQLKLLFPTLVLILLREEFFNVLVIFLYIFNSVGTYSPGT